MCREEFGRTEGKGGSSGTALGSGRGGGGDGGAAEAQAGEKAKSRYLAEHFAFIRDKILQNVVYPPLARRLGWQGKVVLSFVINPNGTIKEPQVAQGSGHEVLDQNALEALKGSVPFPQPPVEARNHHSDCLQIKLTVKRRKKCQIRALENG